MARARERPYVETGGVGVGSRERMYSTRVRDGARRDHVERARREKLLNASNPRVVSLGSAMYRASAYAV